MQCLDLAVWLGLIYYLLTGMQICKIKLSVCVFPSGALEALGEIDKLDSAMQCLGV